MSMQAKIEGQRAMEALFSKPEPALYVGYWPFPLALALFARLPRLTALRGDEEMSKITDARLLADALFQGVVDKGGKPYIGHCERVTSRLPDWVSDDERCAAMLHDVIEDTPTTAADLRRFGFSDRTVALVEQLSRPAGVTYMDWIRQIKATGDRGLIAIKLADNADNSDPERIAQLPESERSILGRYERARRILEA